jgi:hypothetical protein
MEVAGKIEQPRQEQVLSQPFEKLQSSQQVPSGNPLQRYAQMMNRSVQVAQLQAYGAMAQRRVAPQGGLPGPLKSGIESLSGIAMADVRVHYNSSKPAQLQAHAYAQGSEIHLAPGQEKHLPHEAWHVVQQKQGRVKPTLQLKGVAINDDSALEREADVMGAKALMGIYSGATFSATVQPKMKASSVAQLASVIDYGGTNANGVGTSMNAHIDPTDIGGGSAPKEQPGWWATMAGLSPAISDFMARYLVQGHLLNDNVGGPGVMKNMTPITKSANTTMLNFFETKVKDEVITNQKEVKYNVEAKYHYANAPTAAELAGNKLGAADKTLLTNSGQLAKFCDWIYADYSIKDAKHGWADGPGLWVKNENKDLKGDF